MRASLAPVTLALLASASAALYLLPVLIAWVRRAPDPGVVAVINLFLGWTFIGWVIALALALRPARPAGPAVRIVQYVQQLPPQDQREDPEWAGRPGAPFRTDTPPPLTLPQRPAAWPDVPGWSPWASRKSSSHDPSPGTAVPPSADRPGPPASKAGRGMEVARDA